ncbi:MAG: hypothetical protein PW792_06320 [Acidobacteriaceae bacterium]|nr:hypothetical protein [Acidobacteriaceae bacterium]
MTSKATQLENDEDVLDYRIAIDDASKQVTKQARLALIATSSLLAACFLTYLFLEGSPLHRYWHPLGQIVLAVNLATMNAALYYDLLAWGSWSIRRSLKKEFNEFREDRFGDIK